MILTTPIIGNANQVFFNQQNAQGLNAERAEGVHKCAKIVVSVTEILFSTEKVPVTVSSDNSSKGIRYMDPICKVQSVL